MKTFLLKSSYNFSFLRLGALLPPSSENSLYMLNQSSPILGCHPALLEEGMNLDLTATLLICFPGIVQHINLPRSDSGKGRNIDACSAMREDSHPKLLPLLLVFFRLPGLTGLGRTITSQLAHQIGASDSVDHRSLISTFTHYRSQHLLYSHLCMQEKKEERSSPDTQCFKSKEHISGKKWYAVLPHCWLAAVEEEQESTGNAGKQKYSCFSFFIVLVVFFFPSSDNIWLEIEGRHQCAPGHSWLQVWEIYTGWTPQNDTCIYLFTCKLFEPDRLIPDRQVMDCILINTSISEPHTIQLLKYSSLSSSPWTQDTPWNNAYPQGSGGEVWGWDRLLQYFLVLPALEGFYAAFMWTLSASWSLGESNKICYKRTIHKIIYMSSVDESQQRFTISNKSKPSQPSAFPVHHSLFVSLPGLCIAYLGWACHHSLPHKNL